MFLLCSCFGSMGQQLAKLAKGDSKIPEQYLKPQGLYSTERVDLKQLRRLILSKQLVPCYPGAEESHPGLELEECPICFLQYPVLNTSKCCAKRVCTECFLQVKTSAPHNTLPLCPFCKVPAYTAKYVGARTAQDKEQEREEEQKVIEARIREREDEVRRDQERALQRIQEEREQALNPAPPPRTQVTQHHASPVTHGAHRFASPRRGTSTAAAGSQAASSANNTPPQPAGTSQGRTLPPSSNAQRRSQTSTAPSASPAATGMAAPATGTPVALSQVTLTVPPGSQHRRHRSGGNGGGNGAGGGFRLTDYVPAGVTDIALGLEDINDFMLEQALYESALAASREAPEAQPPPPQQLPPQEQLADVQGSLARLDGLTSTATSTHPAAPHTSSTAASEPDDDPFAEEDDRRLREASQSSRMTANSLAAAQLFRSAASNSRAVHLLHSGGSSASASGSSTSRREAATAVTAPANDYDSIRPKTDGAETATTSSVAPADQCPASPSTSAAAADSVKGASSIAGPIDAPFDHPLQQSASAQTTDSDLSRITATSNYGQPAALVLGTTRSWSELAANPVFDMSSCSSSVADLACHGSVGGASSDHHGSSSAAARRRTGSSTGGSAHSTCAVLPTVTAAPALASIYLKEVADGEGEYTGGSLASTAGTTYTGLDTHQLQLNSPLNSTSTAPSPPSPPPPAAAGAAAPAAGAAVIAAASPSYSTVPPPACPWNRKQAIADHNLKWIPGKGFVHRGVPALHVEDRAESESCNSPALGYLGFGSALPSPQTSPSSALTTPSLLRHKAAATPSAGAADAPDASLEVQPAAGFTMPLKELVGQLALQGAPQQQTPYIGMVMFDPVVQPGSGSAVVENPDGSFQVMTPEAAGDLVMAPAATAVAAATAAAIAAGAASSIAALEAAAATDAYGDYDIDYNLEIDYQLDVVEPVAIVDAHLCSVIAADDAAVQQVLVGRDAAYVSGASERDRRLMEAMSEVDQKVKTAILSGDHRR